MTDTEPLVLDFEDLSLTRVDPIRAARIEELREAGTVEALEEAERLVVVSDEELVALGLGAGFLVLSFTLPQPEAAWKVYQVMLPELSDGALALVIGLQQWLAVALEGLPPAEQQAFRLAAERRYMDTVPLITRWVAGREQAAGTSSDLVASPDSTTTEETP